MRKRQVGINVKASQNLNLKYYTDLYSHFLEKLYFTMERYNVEIPDFITNHLKELVLEETIKIGKISIIELSKGLVKLGEVKRNFNNNIYYM